jgi:hypothetical protein
MSNLALLLGASDGYSSDTGAVFARGLSSSEFKSTFSSVARIFCVAGYEASADHLAICQTVEVPNFRPVDFPSLDVNLDLELSGETAEATAVAVVSVSGLQGRLQSYRRRLDISRQVVKNDDCGLLKRISTELGKTAAFHESGLITSLLESNPTLADGEVMFGTDNVVASALTATSLDSAMKALRVQPTAAGNLANHRASVLVVAADLELSAKTILHIAGLAEVRVVVLAGLPDGRWYLLANPAIAPVVGRLVLSGRYAATAAPILIGPAKTPNNFDGISLKCLADLGVVAVNRIGIVKGGV